MKSMAAMITILRVAMGWVFLGAGLDKLLAEGGWSAAGYLRGATGPFAGLFQSLAGVAWVDQLNMWGLTLIGVALIIGVAVRWSSFWGIVVMLSYYFAHFDQNTANGWMDSHVIYALLLLTFLVVGAGSWYGLDSKLRASSGVRRWLLSG
ncbi:MAG: DoxX family protein [bacterium]|nr:DoxX family protein [bacterium]